VDYEKARELLVHHLRYSGGVDLARAHQTHHHDAVLEFPQSGERFVGKANILGFRQRYPARVDYEPRRLRGSGDLWVMEGIGIYDGDRANLRHFVWIVEVRGDKVQRETIYFAEPFPAPDWRQPWAEEAPPGSGRTTSQPASPTGANSCTRSRSLRPRRPPPPARPAPVRLEAAISWRHARPANP
jgi:hypothetical protein